MRTEFSGSGRIRIAAREAECHGLVVRARRASCMSGSEMHRSAAASEYWRNVTCATALMKRDCAVRFEFRVPCRSELSRQQLDRRTRIRAVASDARDFQGERREVAVPDLTRDHESLVGQLDGPRVVGRERDRSARPSTTPLPPAYGSPSARAASIPSSARRQRLLGPVLEQRGERECHQRSWSRRFADPNRAREALVEELGGVVVSASC